MPPNSEKKPAQIEIKAIVDPVTEKTWKTEFTESNTATIREIVQLQSFGRTEEEVVIVAIGLLYSIAKVSAKCEYINVLDDSGKLLRINIPQIPRPG